MLVLRLPFGLHIQFIKVVLHFFGAAYLERGLRVASSCWQRKQLIGACLIMHRCLLLLCFLSAWSRYANVSAFQAYLTAHHYRCVGTLCSLPDIDREYVGTSLVHQQYRVASTNHMIKYCIHRRRSSFAVHMATASDHTNNDDQGVCIPSSPTKCSSRDAAFMIQNSTAQDGLLVITGADSQGRGITQQCWRPRLLRGCPWLRT